MLVARDGHVLFQGGYGLADVEKKTPITPETKFRIGAVTMQFTAAAILKLAEQGKLALGDSLANYFPNLPHAWAITLRHLLTHTSGLHSYTVRPDYSADVVKPIASAELIASMEKDPPDFAPGTNFQYCDTGYFLLGEIVAKVSRRPLADYLRTTFFEPLGMKDTGIFVNATPPPGAALGYSMTDGKGTLAPDWDMSWEGGAGAIYSTVGDLMRWTEALHGGWVVNAASLTAMTTPNPLPPGADGPNYGFGLVMSEVQRLPAIWHNGALPGWSSELLWLPQQKVTVVALSNAMPAPPGLELGALTHELVKHFLGDEIANLPPPAEDKSVDPRTYGAYVGRYNYPTGLFTVSVENDRLYGRFTGQPRYEILPKGGDEFFWKGTDASVRFLRNEKGEVMAAQHLENGSAFRASRLAEDAVKLTAEQLEAYVGEYRHVSQAVFTVTRDEEQLFAGLSGQPALPIFPTGEDNFEWRVGTATVHFVKGGDGKVVKAVLVQNGHTFEVPKVK